MEYIRTKDGIYNIIEIDEVWGFLCNSPQTYGDIYIGTDKAIKFAGPIEELCDAFVIVGTNNYFYEDDVYKVYKDLIYAKHAMVSLEKESHYERDFIIYGAIIRNDKDLICVAKMNEKGELELL